MGPLVATRYRRLIGVGGIGSGMFFSLEGNKTLGRHESRPAKLLDCRDYGKLHIIAHYPAVLARGLRVIPFGSVGEDSAGASLVAEMAEAGMDTQFVRRVSGARTMFSVCFQYPDGSGGNITTSNSACAQVAPEDLAACAPLLSADAIALAAPEVPLETRGRLLSMATEAGALRVASFTRSEIGEADLSRIDLLALNAEEAVGVSPRPGMKMIVTRGADGVDFFDGEWKHQPAIPTKVVSTAGAGDALLGGVLTALAADMPFANAVEFGARLAALAVASPHSIAEL